ncbi:MAG: CHAT domain-containing protein [Microscillaceae bacterium]|nr:CHAT domain-containing protein [Microscillaceae bacterium]
MPVPVIFLAFANDKDAYLSNLKKEADSIYKALQALHDSGKIEIYKEEQTTLANIFDAFTRFRDRIVLFHYAGHAQSQQLFLEDTAANANGLAKLIGEQKNLQLVFLNGCATQGQVQELLQRGVKSVLATAVPIQDNKATEFATQFYQSLASQASLQQAFNEAVFQIRNPA